MTTETTTHKTGVRSRAQAVPIFAKKSTTPAAGRLLAALTATALALGMTVGLASVALAGPPTRPTAPGAAFGRAFALSVPANSRRLPHAFVFALSCSSFGNCATGGTYMDRAGHGQALVIAGQSGRWNRGVELRLPGDAPANVNARVSGIACPRAGVCVAVGGYPKSLADVDFGRIFAATETGGRWQPARELRLPANAASPPQGQLNAVTCTAAGSCLALGDYVDNAGDTQAMLISERNGRWAQATEILPPSSAAPNPEADFYAITCQPGGQCVIAGFYEDSTGGIAALGLVESHGTFVTAQQIPSPPTSTGRSSRSRR
jgi:hypothetical protein